MAKMRDAFNAQHWELSDALGAKSQSTARMVVRAVLPRPLHNMLTLHRTETPWWR